MILIDPKRSSSGSTRRFRTCSRRWFEPKQASAASPTSSRRWSAATRSSRSCARGTFRGQPYLRQRGTVAAVCSSSSRARRSDDDNAADGRTPYSPRPNLARSASTWCSRRSVRPSRDHGMIKANVRLASPSRSRQDDSESFSTLRAEACSARATCSSSRSEPHAAAGAGAYVSRKKSRSCQPVRQPAQQERTSRCSSSRALRRRCGRDDGEFDPTRMHAREGDRHRRPDADRVGLAPAARLRVGTRERALIDMLERRGSSRGTRARSRADARLEATCLVTQRAAESGCRTDTRGDYRVTLMASGIRSTGSSEWARDVAEACKRRRCRSRLPSRRGFRNPETEGPCGGALS